MKLAFSTLGCPGWDIEMVADKAVEYGFDGVELRAQGKQHVDTDMSCSERWHARELFEERKLEICCLSGYTAFGGDAGDQTGHELRDLQQLIDLAVDLKAPAIRIFAKKPDALTLDAAARNVSDVLNQCGGYAVEKGVTILMETHQGFRSGRNMLKILERIHEPRSIGVIWDIHHTLSEGEKPEDTFSLIGPYIRHVHIKDAVHIKNSEDKVCLVGKGELPIRHIVDLLEKTGYDRFLSFEWEKMWIKEMEEPEIALPGFVEFMRGLL
jgi:sugar phosphate isomerase/epimerase